MDKKDIEEYVTDAKFAIAVVKTFWEDVKVKIDGAVSYLRHEGVPRAVWFVVGLVVVMFLLTSVNPRSAHAATPAEEATQAQIRKMLDAPEQMLVADLWAEAIKHGGYADTCAKHVRGNCPQPGVRSHDGVPDGILGQFDVTDPRYITVSTEIAPGSLLYNTTLVHEFTHFLQWWTGKLTPAMTCHERADIEEEAYAAGSKHLAKHNIVQNVVLFIMMMHADCDMPGRI